ncbi:8-oxoguanine deaminase [Reinekea sp. G2M2-21]|uniref:8-oxoguanine deaminase n=1 Tax=Reinekea sp. G2M2-21 TaxID=2788942 RepID=UPI0018AC76CE|nr:8-oxoguanine deaminase [Reinekea sp. G2M2-21]
MVPTSWLKNPLAVYTANSLDARGGIVVRGSQIIELVALGQVPVENVDEVVDVSSCVMLPGLINTHHHLYQTLTRALPAALNKRLFPWLQTLYPIWARLQPDMLASATSLGIAELLKSGCTTIADHHYLFPAALTDAIDIQVAASQALGARVMLTRGSMSLGQKDGGLPPQSTVQTDDQILRDSERVVQKYHQRDDGAMVQIALAPCSPFSVTRELMIETAKLANELDVLMHTHLAETNDENNFCLQMFGMRPVDYLESVGWLTNRTWLAHGIHFNDEEVKRLGNARVGVSHCPSSNMLLASGIARTLEMQAAGVRIGLGVDGSASNDASNMMQEVRQALLIGRLRYTADEVSHLDALNWATKGSAQVIGRSDIGELAVGMQADVTVFSLDELRFSGAHDPLAALILCGAHQAKHVMVGGQWRVRNGELLGADESTLRHQHQTLARKLVNQL